MRWNASRKAGLVVSVSARALNILERDLRLGRPVGDEAPAVGRDGATLLALDDDRGLVGRGDVVAPTRIVDERLRAEDLGQLRRRPLLGEPPAHARESSAGQGATPSSAGEGVVCERRGS